MADEEEMTDREKVEALRMLVIIEMGTAKTMERSDYVMARIASYELVLQAIDRRWPDLPGNTAELVESIMGQLS